MRSLRARGFTEEEWDEKKDTELLWYDVLFWNELDEEKIHLLIALGWIQEIWDAKISDGLALDSDGLALDIGEETSCVNSRNSCDFANVTQELLDLEWEELSPEHRQSFICRGVSEEDWYQEQDDTLVFWYYCFYWHELGEEKERHLTTLGWNEEAWNAKLHDDIVFYRPSAEVRTWSKLTPEHKEAALFLGFDSRTWHVRDWEGDRSFHHKKIKLDIPELLELDLDYLRTLEFKIQTHPEGKPGQDDETIPMIEMTMPEFVDGLREGRDLYMKYEDTESGVFPLNIESTIKHSLSKALQNTHLKDVGRFGPEYDDIDARDSVSMYVGGVNSTSQVHLDLQSFGFIYVVEGVKRIILMPNDQRTSDQFPMVKEVFYSVWPGVDILNGPLPEHAQEFILEKGEGIQIPYFTWHAVQNLEPCISYGLMRDWQDAGFTKSIPIDYQKSRR
eukprot:scaffold145101_cov59-Attheya_sp.AAC.3